MSQQSETVVVLGASDKPERYAHKALTMLKEHGHRIIPVHPRLQSIDDIPVVATLAGIAELVDTVTLYVNPSISEPMAAQLIGLKPHRVIFNPGTESAILATALQEADIETSEACTLVLLVQDNSDGNWLTKNQGIHLLKKSCNISSAISQVEPSR